MNIPDNIIIPIFIIGLIYIIYQIGKIILRMFYDYLDYKEEQRMVRTYDLRKKRHIK